MFEENKNLSKFEKEFLTEFFNDLELRENSRWTKGWTFNSSKNAFSNHEYTGINSLFLELYERKNNITDTRYATFKQAKDNDYTIRKGAKGIPIQFFTLINSETKRAWNEEEFKEKIKNMSADEIKIELAKKIPVFKRFHVFNANDLISRVNEKTFTENNPLSIKEEKIITPSMISSFEENLISEMNIELIEKYSDRAYYNPKDDTVTLPLKDQFQSLEDRVSTLIHELGHASGHESRLHRDLTGTFGSLEYSMEELRVELNSVFMSNELGLNLTEEMKINHLKYLDSWGKFLQDEPKLFMNVLSDSLKIKEYMIEISNLDNLINVDNKRENFINKIKTMLEEDPDMKYGNSNEIIYEIDEIKIYGGFQEGIRSVDHNVLKDENIDWEEILLYGTVVVPEEEIYISDENISFYDQLGYSRLPLDNNYIVGEKEIEKEIDLTNIHSKEIIEVSEEKIREAVELWENGELGYVRLISEDIENGKPIYTVLDNTSDNCNVETFKNRELADNFLDGYFEIGDLYDLCNEYNSYCKREFGNNDFIRPENIVDPKLGLGFTEEVYDIDNFIEYSKEVNFDIVSGVLDNQVYNEFITISNKENYTFEDLAFELESSEVEDWLSDHSLGISLDEVTEAIILSSYTNDDKFIKDLALENKYDVEYNFEYILENRNEILKNIGSELPEFFIEKNVELNNDFIQDVEYKNLVNFQLSHYQNIEEHIDLDGNYTLYYNSDIEKGSDNIKKYTNYADLWEENYKEDFLEDFNNFTRAEIEEGIKSSNLLNKLGIKYEEYKNFVDNPTLKPEKDLDNDGVSDRIDIDDTRNSVQTVSDLDLVRNDTIKKERNKERTL